MTDYSSMKLLLDHYVSSQRCHIKTHPWFHCCITVWLTRLFTTRRQWTTVTSLPASLSFIITIVVTTTTIFRICSTYYYGRRQIIKKKIFLTWRSAPTGTCWTFPSDYAFFYTRTFCVITDHCYWKECVCRIHFLYTPLLLLVVKINPKARIPGGPWRVDPFFIVWLLEIWNWVFGQRRILEVMKVKTQIEVKWRN